jgi:outer membrane protein OmpA-like peptidoglycan-associated protein
VAANAAVIDQLLLLQGRDEPGAAPTDAPIVTASSNTGVTINRLGQAIAAARVDPDWDRLGDARQALLGSAAVLVATWKSMPADPHPPARQPKKELQEPIGDLCAAAIRPGFAESAAEQRGFGRIASAVPGQIPFAIGDDQVPLPLTPLLGGLNNTLQRERHPQVSVRIDGYASGDSVADPQALSERRADAVKTELLSGGAIDPHIVAKAGHGESPGGPRVEMVAVQAGDAANPLLEPNASQPIRDLSDLLLDLRNEGTDNSTGQRHIYTDHAYSVVGVSFTMANEVKVPLGAVPAEVRHCLYPLVDADVSTVTLRNPHHKNEPDPYDNGTAARDGDGPPAGASSDGTFRVSLRQFLLSFSSVTSGVLPKS